MTGVFYEWVVKIMYYLLLGCPKHAVSTSRQADAALYTAKNSGRDQVIRFSEE